MGSEESLERHIQASLDSSRKEPHAPHAIEAATRLLTVLLLGLAAVWALLAGITTDRVTLAQRKHMAVPANPLALRPVVVATIPLSVPSPLIQATVAVNPATGYAYVLAHAEHPYPYSYANLMIISGTEVISNSIDCDYGSTLAVNPDRGHVYIPGVGGLVVISGTEIVAVIPTDSTFRGQAIGVEPKSGCIYADGYDWQALCFPETPWCAGIVWVLANASSTRLNVGGLVHAIGVNPATGYVYATCRTGGLWDWGYTVVIHGTEEISQVHSFGEAVGINPDTGYVYIVEADQNRLHVLSGTQVVQALAVGTEPRAVGINSHTGYVYVANSGSNNVTVISKTQVITTLAVGLEPEAIGVNPVTGYTYVTNAADDTLSVISGTQVVWSISTGQSPEAVGINPDAGYAYVVNYDDATVSIIREMALPHWNYLPLVVKR
jgi:YVTN family beta-propeller protein